MTRLPAIRSLPRGFQNYKNDHGVKKFPNSLRGTPLVSPSPGSPYPHCEHWYLIMYLYMQFKHQDLTWKATKAQKATTNVDLVLFLDDPDRSHDHFPASQMVLLYIWGHLDCFCSRNLPLCSFYWDIASWKYLIVAQMQPNFETNIKMLVISKYETFKAWRLLYTLPQVSIHW